MWVWEMGRRRRGEAGVEERGEVQRPPQMPEASPAFPAPTPQPWTGAPPDSHWAKEGLHEEARVHRERRLWDCWEGPCPWEVAGQSWFSSSLPEDGAGALPSLELPPPGLHPPSGDGTAGGHPEPLQRLLSTQSNVDRAEQISGLRLTVSYSTPGGFQRITHRRARVTAPRSACMWGTFQC